MNSQTSRLVLSSQSYCRKMMSMLSNWTPLSLVYHNLLKLHGADTLNQVDTGQSPTSFHFTEVSLYKYSRLFNCQHSWFRKQGTATRESYTWIHIHKAIFIFFFLHLLCFLLRTFTRCNGVWSVTCHHIVKLELWFSEKMTSYKFLIIFLCIIQKVKSLIYKYYSNCWSIWSCFRTLLWLVSLISPAKNISSTTEYTWCQDWNNITRLATQEENGIFYT